MTTDSRIDAYIRHAQPFAHDILRHLRAVVHEACPEVEETIKWSFPHFDYQGMLCSMAAFKAHATFGFWKHRLLAERLSVADRSALAMLDRIGAREALPARRTLVRIVRTAARMNDEGLAIVRPPRPPRAAPRPPADLAAALAADARASATFKQFSPSHKREYVEWIVDAKQAVTREKRVATAVAWMAEGKPRNWKYMK